MFQFCKLLPKVELHAHINGSINNETCLRVLKEQGHDTQHIENIIMRDEREFVLEDAFTIFNEIHKIMNSVALVKAMTKDVICDFAADNVRYLELRTTPRACPETGMTRRGYIAAVIAAIAECTQLHYNIIVKLLLSIDRTQPLEAAWDTVKWAGKLVGEGVVVGIDFSGNPHLGDARQFLPVLQAARERGLKIAVHLAEKPKSEEVLDVVQFLPDRIGHGTCLLEDTGGSSNIQDCVVRNKIPIELCMTSNVKCQTVASYSQHHFQHWYNKGHPCILGTDDKGVFQTSLSREYLIAATTFQLTTAQLWQLSYDAIDYCFINDDAKLQLRQIWLNEQHVLFQEATQQA